VSVPGDYTAFELGFFDGDSGKDNNGNVNFQEGNWDNTTAETTYTLYADPLKDGTGTFQVRQWSDREMPNNAWHTVSVENVMQAKGPSGHYFYRLEATRPASEYGINAFKVRSNGYLGTGQAELVNSSFAIVGMVATSSDVRILYPSYQNSNNRGASTYTGDWQFYFYVPNETVALSLWDGDFDRGSWDRSLLDTDDPNTEGKPEWASGSAVAERAAGRGSPADNAKSYYRRDPAVKYSLIDPDGTPLYVNDDPSGTEEWEYFLISTDQSLNPDLQVGQIKPGFYNFHIEGLDIHNTVWIRLNYEVCDAEDGCGPTPWPEGNCPRTIGYWKNNVSKVLAGRTNGVQESPETLAWA